MLELKLNGIKKYMEATLVVKDVSLEVYEGDKVGIVGANGSGKSTILKLIAGIEPMNYYPGYPQTSSHGYDEGLIHMSRGATTAYLEQSPVYPKGVKVSDVLNLAFEEIDRVEKQMRELEEQLTFLQEDELQRALTKYSDLTQLFEVKGGYEREEKMSRVCTGLQLTESFLEREFDLLSGGEKTTVILGKLLIHEPDILLLDEPTNHLDMESIEWLEGYLKSYKGMVIIVSHDRYFLDNVVTKIMEIEDMSSISYKGNYSAFISQKEENMRIQYEHFREQQKKIHRMEKTVLSLRDWAMRADNTKFFKRAASVQKKLDKMDRIDKPVFDRRNMRLDVRAAERSGNETIKAVGLSKRYENKKIFNNTDVMIRFGERVGLLGPNGSGKTTFLKMLMGEERPDEGVLEFGANVKAAYLPQNIAFNNEEVTVLDCFREDLSIHEGKAREYLAKFMFYKGTVFKKVKHLSGGERIRLKLAMLLFQDTNLLILDEPTNHLDIDSIETLEEALEDFGGTIFFISHDRYFINRMAERIIAVEDYSLRSYQGNYDEYKSEIERIQSLKERKGSVDDESKNPLRKSEVINEEMILAKVLKKIERLENDLREIDLAMETGHIEYDELNNLYSRKLDVVKELDAEMELWLRYSE
jgi:ATP-binding cassette, subfamily F, member 3